MAFLFSIFPLSSVIGVFAQSTQKAFTIKLIIFEVANIFHSTEDIFGKSLLFAVLE
jgi:hypothetical protein